jgi:hypothetical protein
MFLKKIKITNIFYNIKIDVLKMFVYQEVGLKMDNIINLILIQEKTFPMKYIFLRQMRKGSNNNILSQGIKQC